MQSKGGNQVPTTACRGSTILSEVRVESTPSNVFGLQSLHTSEVLQILKSTLSLQ